MSSVQPFENVLKEVVTAKRLSASKMNKLTEIALNNMENDTELVSTLYRTHKTLGPSSKVHSLYVFDALARAARSKVSKSGLIGDINAEKGNCATFLLKIDGVLDALIQDMMSIGTPESKEKTRKILDIWTKNNTFPSSVLTRLGEFTKGSLQKDTTPTPHGPTTDPRVPATGHTAVSQPPKQAVQQQPPPVAPESLQAQALLQAILSSAVSSVGDITKGSTPGQTSTNIPGGLQANQVTLLQQLVEKAKAGQGNGNGNVLGSAAVGQADQLQSQVHQLGSQVLPTSYDIPPYESSAHDPYLENKESSAYKREQSSSSSSRDQEEWQGRERGGWRGGYHGGSRNGYPERGGKSWRDDERDAPPRRRRSRSRSPPRHPGGRGGGPRSSRPYSPPRRPSLIDVPANETEKNRRMAPGASEPGKDEFGRDIRRSASPKIEREDTKPPIVDRVLDSQKDHNSSTQDSPVGLDQVDFSKIDFSSPVAWEALGKAWQVTHGNLPTQEQLMQLVMGGIAQLNAGYSSGPTGYPSGNLGNTPQPGKSIPTYESGSNLNTNSWHFKGSTWQDDHPDYDYEHGGAPLSAETDAVVLGGDGETYEEDAASNANAGTGDGGARAGMKRIGDGWVWQAS